MSTTIASSIKEPRNAPTSSESGTLGAEESALSDGCLESRSDPGNAESSQKDSKNGKQSSQTTRKNPTSSAAASHFLSLDSIMLVRSVGTWTHPTTAFKSTQTCAPYCTRKEDAAPRSVALGSIKSIRSVETWTIPTAVFKGTQTCALCCDRKEEVCLAYLPKCTVCGDVFSSEEYLEKHQRARHSRKGGRHQCQFCDYSSDNINHVKHHEMGHRGEKPHVCEICSRRFTQRARLNIHLNTHLKTVHEKKRDYECSTCGRVFQRKASLENHERIHTNEKPFVCGECGRAFTQRGGLSMHLRFHSGKKPYTCTHCEKSFTQLSDLKRHTVSVHTKDSRQSLKTLAKHA